MSRMVDFMKVTLLSILLKNKQFMFCKQLEICLSGRKKDVSRISVHVLLSSYPRLTKAGTQLTFLDI